MEQVKQMLAERCAEKGKTPVYINQLHSLRDIFGQPVVLSDVKAGRMYKMSFDAMPMERANVVLSQLKYPYHDGHGEPDPPYKVNYKPEGKSMEVSFMVTDVLHHNGMVFIETYGAAYSTIDFPKEWNYILENEERRKVTDTIHKAADEVDKWFKDDSVKLAKEFGLWNVISRHDCKKELLNGISTSAARYLSEHNHQTPYSKEVVDEIKKIVTRDVNRQIDEIKRAKELAIARELVAINLPVICCSSSIENDVYSLEKETGVPEKKFTTFNFNGRMRSMLDSSHYLDSQCRLPYLTLMDIKKVDDRTFYITDRAILTDVNISTAYRTALKEAGYDTRQLSTGGMQSLMAGLLPNPSNVFKGEEFLSLVAWPNRHETPEQVKNDKFNQLSEQLYEAGLIPQFFAMSKEKNTANIRMIDANGVQHDIGMKDIYPGMKVVMIDDRDEFANGRTAENGVLTEVKEVMRVGSDDFALVTDRGMFITRQDFIEHFNTFMQAKELEHDDQSQEVVESHDRT